MNPPLEDPWTIPPPLDRTDRVTQADVTPGHNPPGGASTAAPQAQYTQPEFPQGQYTQAQYPQGQYPQAQYPQAQYTQAQYTQPEFPQAQPAQAQYAQGQYPQAQYPQGQYPQAQYTQGQYGAVPPQGPGYPGSEPEYEIPLGQSPGMPGSGDDSGPQNESHLTIYAPSRLKLYLIGGALVLLAGFGLTRMIGGNDGETPVAVEATAEEPAEETPEELAFDDLEERIDDLEDAPTDDDDIIIIDDNNGYGGGGGCCGYGNGNGYGNGIGDGNDGGIILDGDDIEPENAADEDVLVIDTDADEPVLGDGADGEPALVEFPSCDVDHDGDGGEHGGDDSNNDGGERQETEVSFPYSDGFDLGAPASWAPLNGAWGLTGEVYQQTDPDTYGNLTELEVELPERYSIRIDITPLGDTIGGGVMLAQPTPGKRSGSVIVDLTEGGTFVRFGHYDADTGDYSYDGGVATPEGFDPSTTHSFGVDATAEKTVVLLDGEIVGEFGPVGSGHMGLFTSLAAVSFDNLTIEAI